MPNEIHIHNHIQPDPVLVELARQLLQELKTVRQDISELRTDISIMGDRIMATMEEIQAQLEAIAAQQTATQTELSETHAAVDNMAQDVAALLDLVGQPGSGGLTPEQTDEVRNRLSAILDAATLITTEATAVSDAATAGAAQYDPPAP